MQLRSQLRQRIKVNKIIGTEDETIISDIAEWIKLYPSGLQWKGRNAALTYIQIRGDRNPWWCFDRQAGRKVDPLTLTDLEIAEVVVQQFVGELLACNGHKRLRFEVEIVDDHEGEK